MIAIINILSRLRDDESGAALVTVVWVTTLIALLAASVLSAALITRESQNALEESYAEEQFVRSVIEIFMHRYFYDPDERIYSGGTITIMDTEVTVTVTDEAGKVNVNRAAGEWLALPFVEAGMTELEALTIADRIIDWRDQDDFSLPLGMETDDYEGSTNSIRPRNDPLETIAELLHIPGVDANAFLCALPFYTLHSLNAEPDIAQSTQAFRDMVATAFTENTFGKSWPDVEFIDSAPNIGNVDEGIVGKALSIRVEFGKDVITSYEQIIRFKSTASIEYSILTPLRKSANPPISCFS